MANIGSFKKVGNDFQGEIVTLSLQAKGVRIVADRGGFALKNHRIGRASKPVGAVWLAPLHGGHAAA